MTLQSRKNSSGISAFCAIILISVLSASRLSAQATANIVGTVTDTSGAAIAGANVQVKNVGTGVTQNAITDAAGRYRAPDLGIGTYELHVSQSGFQTVFRTGITLTVGSEPVVDFALPVGTAQQTVTVEGEISQVETQETAMGSLVETKQITDLPLNGRNYTSLLALAPGVIQIPLGQLGAGSTFYGNGQKYSIAGSRPSGQPYMLDDQNMVNFWNDGPGAGGLGTALGVEAIAEFQTLTNTYSPQFGGNGAVINATSRPGTNGFHGSAYEFLRNDVLETRNFFDIEKPAFRQNQFGGSLGGPIKKDKIFFFANYEGLRRYQGVTSVVVVPDACVHNAVVSGAPGTAGCAINAATSTNPQVAQSVANIMTLYPLPNYISEIGGGTGEATVIDPNKGAENYVLGRIDYNVNAKSSIFFRYIYDYANRDFTGAAGGLGSSGALPYWPEFDRSRDHFMQIEERQILTPNLVNLVHAGFSRTYEDAYVYGSPTVSNGVVSLGTIATPVTSSGTLAGNVAPGPTGLSPGVHPLQFFNITNPASPYYAVSTAGQGILREDGSVSPGSGITGIAASSTLPFYLVPNKFQFGDDVIWTSGAHSIRAGISAQRLRENTWAPFDVGPQWTFANLTSFIAGSAATLNGQVSGTQNPLADATKDYRYWVFEPYIEDQWKVSKKLTVNLGVRYSPTTLIGNVRHAELNLINPPFGNYVPVSRSTAVNPSLRNWDPRVGLAFDPFADHKTSIRAGFGVFHNVDYSRDENNWLQPPFLTATQAAPNISFPTPYSNLPIATGIVVPDNGSLTCTNCDYYGYHTTPYQYQWNFNIEREVMANTVFTIGYVGSRNLHLNAQKDFNYPVPFIGASGLPTFGVYNATANAVVANPRINPAYGYLQMVDALGDSHYEALQTALNRRFSNGLQFFFSYTFSKSIDDTSGSYGLDGGGAVYNPTSATADTGLSNFDREHNFRASVLYQLPPKAHGFLGAVVNGWEVTGIYTYLSGDPFAVGTTANRVDNATGANAQRPDAVPGCNLYAGFQTINEWFNPACFTPAPVGTYGDAGRDTIIGPNLWDMDNSLSKYWAVPKISEVFRIQFRAEAFNMLNHPNFNNPAAAQAAVFNAALSAAVATNPYAGVTPNATVGRITSTNSTPRQIQLGLKVLF
jgi:hypothetical protein